MNRQLLLRLVIVGAMLAVLPAGADESEIRREQDHYQTYASAVRAVVDHARRLIVQIQPIGGGDPLSRGTSDATRPKTGLIATDDGLILTSSFGLDPRPSALLVTFDGGQRTTADLLAIDRNRQLALLKPLRPLDEPPRLLVPAASARVGQTAIAVGRTLRADEPNVSVGIISAVDRLYGRAIQTDAAASPANYGGPLLNLQGEVMGVLTPLAPAAMSEAGGGLGGAEWYDSGIGFAVPLPSVLARLERLRRGEDIYRGRAGLTFEKGSVYSTEPRVRAVHPGGPADTAGLRPGDVIDEVNGMSVTTVNGYRAAADAIDDGETLSLVVLRDAARATLEVRLAAELRPYRHPYLGLIAQRDADQATVGEGLVIAAVAPNSPADAAGIAADDVLLQVNGSSVSSRQGALAKLAAIRVGDPVRLAWRRGEQEMTGVATASPLDFLPGVGGERANTAALTEWVEEVLGATAAAPAFRLTRPAQADRRLPVLLLLREGRLGGGGLRAKGRGGDGAMLSETHAADTAETTAARLATRGCLVVEPLVERPLATREEVRSLLASVSDRLRTRSDVDPNRVAVSASGPLAPAVLSIATGEQSRFGGALIDDWPNQPVRVGPCGPAARVGLQINGVGRRNEALLDRLKSQGYAADRLQTPEGSGAGPVGKSNAIADWLAGLDRF